MSRTLPKHPSLVQLKHQAKDLRIAARERDPQALSLLRALHRFAHSSDAEIAAARVQLSEAQFALALAYGARSWPDLTARVAAMRAEGGPAPRSTRRPLAIEGLETARWGGGTRRHCSTIATLALLSERSDDQTDYDYLMGASGAAFRIQMSEGQLCPSSSHAICGFNCADLAFRAWGNDVTWFDTRDANAETRTRAQAPVHDSLERGVPVLYEREESSLIVGCAEDGALLMRLHSARLEGYEPMKEWPWQIGVASAKVARPDAMAVLRDSLRVATQLFDTPHVGGYTCGHRAYQHWIEQLRDDAALDALAGQQRFIAMLGNAHTWGGLGDARGAAANYLHAMAADAPASAQQALADAAERYAEMELLCREQRSELAPYPFELAGPAWTADHRARQIAQLGRLEELDVAAVAHLQTALARLDDAPPS